MICILFFLLFPVHTIAYQYTNHSSFQSTVDNMGGGATTRVSSYREEGDYNDIISYRFDISDFPPYICVSDDISKTKARLISQATDIWEDEYKNYLKKFYSISEAMSKKILPPYNLFRLTCSDYDVYITESDLYQPDRKVYGRTDYSTFFFHVWLLDIKVIFNESFGFTLFPAIDNNGSSMYFLNTALHELGHVLSLGHTKKPNLMYPDASVIAGGKLIKPDESNIRTFLMRYAEVGRNNKGIEYIKVER